MLQTLLVVHLLCTDGCLIRFNNLYVPLRLKKKNLVEIHDQSRDFYDIPINMHVFITAYLRPAWIWVLSLCIKQEAYFHNQMCKMLQCVPQTNLLHNNK